MRERIEKLVSTAELERRMKGDLIETFRIINGISNYDRHFFNISLRSGNLLSEQISKTKSTNQLDIFFFFFFFFLLIEKKKSNPIKNRSSVPYP